MNFRAICLLLTALVGFSSSAQETRRQYLSGKGIDDAVPWEFFCTGGAKSGEWTTLAVPSQWDVLGFGKLAYGRPPRGEQAPSEQGKYRHRFRVPAEWAGQTVFLVFEGSMTDTAAMVNGQSAGPTHQGGFYRFEYDVTKLVKTDAENLLEVTVDKESANASINSAERRGDYWNFGGIFRPVYLEARPTQHVSRVAIDARADGAFTMDVFTSGVTAADTIQAQIIDASGKPVGDAFSRTLADGKARLTTKIESPRQWTAETPDLYQVEVRLVQNFGSPFHLVRQKFGFRTIEMRPGEGVFVNGQRVLLKGTNRHSFWPESGRAGSERLSRADVALMKEMNNNAVRMSHYPPDEHFLDLCDEAGLYVLDELGGWSKSYDTPTGTRLIEQMIKRDVNHPSILFWCNGNENGWNTAVDDEFAKWDPQGRAVLHPWAKFRGTNTKHYPVYDLHVQLSNGPETYFPTEFMHALFDGGGGASLQDYWDVVRAGKSAAGGFIWAFVDESLKRPDQDGKMDGAGNQAPDGIVGPYREKEASFYAVKQVWSPVVVTRDGSGKFVVENRYDFTNADRCAFTWQHRKFVGRSDAKSGYTVVREGKVAAPSIAPHGTGSLDLRLDASSDADALALRVEDPTGRELWTWVWPMRNPGDATAATPPGPAPANGKVTAVQNDKSLDVTTGDLRLSFSLDSGYLASITRAGIESPLRNGPRLVAGDAKLVSMKHRADGADCVVHLEYSGDLKSVQWRIHPDGWAQVDYAYALTGSFDFLGVGFDLPEEKVKGMKWLGDGPFRVWKNRLVGNTLGVWENAYNNTTTGHNTWVYPEFKGYYAGVRWMKLQTTDGPILLALSDPSLFVQVLRPEWPGNPKPHSPTTAATRAISANSTLHANAWTTFPQAGLSILHGIPGMGTKFNIAPQMGPQGKQNVAAGEYRGSVRLYFGEEKTPAP